MFIKFSLLGILKTRRKAKENNQIKGRKKYPNPLVNNGVVSY